MVMFESLKLRVTLFYCHIPYHYSMSVLAAVEKEGDNQPKELISCKKKTLICKRKLQHFLSLGSCLSFTLN